jgi:hypothetical protein
MSPIDFSLFFLFWQPFGQKPRRLIFTDISSFSFPSRAALVGKCTSINE